MTLTLRPRLLLTVANVLLILVPAGFGWAWLADQHLVGKFLPPTIVFGLFIVGLRWILRHMAGKTTPLTTQATLFAVMTAGIPAVGTYLVLLEKSPALFAVLAFFICAQVGWRATTAIRRTLADINRDLT